MSIRDFASTRWFRRRVDTLGQQLEHVFSTTRVKIKK